MSTHRTPIDRAAEASFKAGAENAARELGLATPVQWANLRAGDQEHVRIQARAAVSAALHDPDYERGPDEDLAPGSLARAIWETELTDGTRGVTVRDARALADAVRAAILGADS